MALISLLSKGAQRKINPDMTAFDLLNDEFIQTADFLTDFDRRKLTTIKESIKEYNAVRAVGTTLTSAQSSKDFFRDRLHDLSQERMEVALLSSKNTVLAIKTVFQGTVNACPVHPREIFREAVKYPTAGIILGHNHPSGDLTPSIEDQKFTHRMIQAGELMGIDVLDHIIVSSKGAISMAETTGLF